MKRRGVRKDAPAAVGGDAQTGAVLACCPMLKTVLLVGTRGGFLLYWQYFMPYPCGANPLGANLPHNGSIPFYPIGSCVHPIFRSRLIKKLSHLIIYYPQHNFQFQAHGSSLYESISYPARHGILPLHHLSNESCLQRNPICSSNAPVFIVFQSRNNIRIGFEALCQFNCVFNSLTCPLA